jgi:hypothetical protein
MARRRRYRFRTWARRYAPGPLPRLFPPGSKDCGEHEWFRADEHTDLCWHCTVGEREHQHTPIDWKSDLWRELTKLADEGNPTYQRIVRKMRTEEAAGRQVA